MSIRSKTGNLDGSNFDASIFVLGNVEEFALGLLNIMVKNLHSFLTIFLMGQSNLTSGEYVFYIKWEVYMQMPILNL